MKMPIIKFHITAKEIKKLDKENDIRLLRLLKYLKKEKVKNEK